MDRRIVSDTMTATRPPNVESSTPPISTPSDYTEDGRDNWIENPPYPPGYGTAPARMKQRPSSSSTSSHRSGASTGGVSEFGALNGAGGRTKAQIYATGPRGTQGPTQGQVRPKAPGTQTLPSRVGRRPRAPPEMQSEDGQDFGVSLERMRVSPTYS